MHEAKLQVVEELVLFEEQLSCQIVPKSFCRSTQMTTTHDKKHDQRCQRAMLDQYMEKCETTIQNYDRCYQQERSMLELELSAAVTGNQRGAILALLEAYIAHRNDQIRREIFLKVSFFRSGMSRRCRRYHRSTSIKSQTAASVVFPQVIVDAPNVPFDKAELAYLSRGNADDF